MCRVISRAVVGKLQVELKNTRYEENNGIY